MFVKVKDVVTRKQEKIPAGIFPCGNKTAPSIDNDKQFYVNVQRLEGGRGVALVSHTRDAFEFVENVDEADVSDITKIIQSIQDSQAAKVYNESEAAVNAEIEQAQAEETDDEVLDRLNENFEILDHMVNSVLYGTVTSLVVSGPAGVGKSHNIHAAVSNYAMTKGYGTTSGSISNELFDVVKGSMTAFHLYKKLYEYKDRDNVLVFDDCDSIFFDDDSLNLLKGAMDSTLERKVGWYSENRTLKEEGIPTSFIFRGSIIFITNLDFEKISEGSKLKPHLNAIESRAMYLDLEMSSTREKAIRIQDVAYNHNLFGHNDIAIEDLQVDALMRWIYKNRDNFKDLSIRTALKMAGLITTSSAWDVIAAHTLFTKVAKNRYVFEKKQKEKEINAKNEAKLSQKLTRREFN